MFQKNQDPILVVVANGRYVMYGPPNARSAFLTKLLKKLGGVNQSVTDGNYHFNAKRISLFKYETSLNPID